MIGGYDVILTFPHPHSPAYLTSVICLMTFRTWPEYVIEPDEKSEDVFLYRNAAAKESWDKCGLTRENEADMLYVLYNDDGRGLTIALGKYNDDNRKILTDIKTYLGAKENNGNKSKSGN